ncbi:MAG: hypothetical protein AAGF77_00075 [Bacteroidota bacterium]
MSNFLSNILSRHLGESQNVQPRKRSLYENPFQKVPLEPPQTAQVPVPNIPNPQEHTLANKKESLDNNTKHFNTSSAPAALPLVTPAGHVPESTAPSLSPIKDQKDQIKEGEVKGPTAIPKIPPTILQPSDAIKGNPARILEEPRTSSLEQPMTNPVTSTKIKDNTIIGQGSIPDQLPLAQTPSDTRRGNNNPTPSNNAYGRREEMTLDKPSQTIKITIGKIEVGASSPQKKKAPERSKKPKNEPKLSLAQFLNNGTP